MAKLNTLTNMESEVTQKALVEAENHERMQSLKNEDILNRFRNTAIRTQERLGLVKERHEELGKLMSQKLKQMEETLNKQQDN